MNTNAGHRTNSKRRLVSLPFLLMTIHVGSAQFRTSDLAVTQGFIHKMKQPINAYIFYGVVLLVQGILDGFQNISSFKFLINPMSQMSVGRLVRLTEMIVKSIPCHKLKHREKDRKQ
jgi:hypothetical protein